jgi:hypothetical protein
MKRSLQEHAERFDEKAPEYDADKSEEYCATVSLVLDRTRSVLGDVMFFGEPDPEESFYSPEVDDPSTVGHLVDTMTSAGFAVTAVDRVHDQVGVITCERR